VNTSITDYGASVSTENNAPAIQRAIDSVHEEGGGKVIIPAGEFRSGGIQLRSGVCLSLAEGAVLKGSPHLADYPSHFIEHFSTPGGERLYTALIYAEGAQDITIEGPGKIDGNGGAPEFRCYPLEDGSGAWHKPSRPWGIRLWKCRDVRLENYTIESTAEWSHHICDCDEVRVDGIRIFNHANANNDGLDFDGCRGVLVTDCEIDADDDALCIKSTGFRANRNIRVRKCRLASRCRVIHFGTESSGAYEDIVIEDCSIVPTRATRKVDTNRSDDAACAIEIASVEGSVMRDLIFRNLSIEGCQTAIFVHLGLISPDRPKYAGHTLQTGQIEGLTFSHIRGSCSSPVASSITAAPGHSIDKVLLEDIDLSIPGNPRSFTDDVPELTSGWHAHAFGQDLPASGLYLRRVADPVIRNCRWIPIETDPRPEVACFSG
jgi:polygalacturonase